MPWAPRSTFLSICENRERGCYRNRKEITCTSTRKQLQESYGCPGCFIWVSKASPGPALTLFIFSVHLSVVCPLGPILSCSEWHWASQKQQLSLNLNPWPEDPTSNVHISPVLLCQLQNSRPLVSVEPSYCLTQMFLCWKRTLRLPSLVLH